MFDVFYIGKKPGLFVHEQQADSIEHACQLSRTRYLWVVNYLSDYTDWDWLWEPPPWQSHQRHAWASQWQKDSSTYLVPKIGYTDTNYHPAPVVQRLPSSEHWQDIQPGFDLSWHPDPTEPPMIYQFGTQWQKTGGPRYHSPGATVIKYVDQPRWNRDINDDYWEMPDHEIQDFDFTWHPDDTDPPYVYQFGTQWQKTGGPVYRMPGATEIKFVALPRAIKVSKDAYWQIPPGAVYDDGFDWTWHPDTTEQPYIYQFGTQHQKTGGPLYSTPGATEVKYVDQVRVIVKASTAPVYVIDHMDGSVGTVRDDIGDRVEIVKTVRYVDNYLDTLSRIAQNATDHEYIWICSSLCDYKNFDFTWYPEQWQATMLHVFASNGEKFGDTFFMHVPTFLLRSATCQLLEWYDLNFVEKITVSRRPLPVIAHDHDSQVDAVLSRDWQGPLALFACGGARANRIPAVPLWREKTKAITPLSKGGSLIIVPKTAVPKIKSQIYDYEWVDKSCNNWIQERQLDIVFISNGESNADRNWEWLKESCQFKMVPNRLVRVDGVNGRAAAYRAALEASNTAWAFCVFAKLRIDPTFDWSWQPDRLQAAKHYIFHAKNPVNGLIYGHQAVIAYNKELVMRNSAEGLDFTLDQAHEVVPVLSGTAWYADSAWMAWRTAFREALKLKNSLPDVENEYRLSQWLKENNNDDYAQWSHLGAQDAVEYYEEVGGDFAALKKSYEWDWLASYAMLKRNLLPDR